MTNTSTQRVCANLLKNQTANVNYFRYDRQELEPGIVHIGVGGFHRSHQALYLDDLFNLEFAKPTQDSLSWSICGVGIMPQDKTMSAALLAQDCLYTLVERDTQKCSARIIGAVTHYLFGCEATESVFKKLADPAIKIVSLTATEGGYCFNQGTGELDLSNKGVVNDLTNPLKPQTIFGYLAEGLERRRQAGLPPFTVLSCDNLQGNGKVARRTLLTFCGEKNPQLSKWIEENVSFPNCMVDRITPATTDAERQMVRETFGLEDGCPVVCEPFKQWVVEDTFCNGRPALEKVGVQFTTDVAPYEKMKIRLLNASHSAMGYLGYLCGYRYIYEIARAQEFVPYIKSLMDFEVTPLIGTIPGVNLQEYKEELMKRFGNETIKDQALRICMDGSSKMPKFILPSIQEQLEREGPIRKLSLCVASWIRFLDGIDEKGQPIPIQDPQAERLTEAVRKANRNVKPLLDMTDLFADLRESERFVVELQALLDMIYEQGARGALEFAKQ
jgi:mannitol 2-dehydrogenase